MFQDQDQRLLGCRPTSASRSCSPRWNRPEYRWSSSATREIVIRASACSDDAPPRSLISSRCCGDRHELLCGVGGSPPDLSTAVARAFVAGATGLPAAPGPWSPVQSDREEAVPKRFPPLEKAPRREFLYSFVPTLLVVGQDELVRPRRLHSNLLSGFSKRETQADAPLLLHPTIGRSSTTVHS